MEVSSRPVALKPRSSLRRFFAFMVLAAALALIVAPVTASPNTNYVVVVNINGEINYGTELKIQEALSQAEQLNAPLLVVLDTPGGLVSSAINIIKMFKNSRVPVIGYVYPLGASAWSAGTMILMATHVAAMAPGTHIGAAQPVFYDPATGEYRPINESKIINPLVGIITGLAEDRGRNTTAAKLFVLKNLYLSAQDALKYHVIEYIARTPGELMEELDGLTVQLDIGVNYTLHTAGARLVSYHSSVRVYVVEALSDPIINGLVATLGVLMLIFGVLSGHYLTIPLAIGLIILSLIGSGFSVNAVSLALLVLGAIALGIELFTPGFGILGFTGIILIALSISLLPMLNPNYLVSPAYQAMLFWTGIGIGIGLGAFTGFAVYKIIKARRLPPRLTTIPVEKIGKAIDEIGPSTPGFVIVEGEYWRAVSDKRIPRNTHVKVVGKRGPYLVVEPVEERETDRGAVGQ